MSKLIDRVITAASQHQAQVALMKFLSQVAKREGVAEHIYVVGGAVRNFVLGVPIKDVDVVVDTVVLSEKFRRARDSEWFAKVIQGAIPTSTDLTTNQYGVAILTVKGSWVLDGHDMRGEVIEIANARKESYGGHDGKGYKPHTVEPATVEEDVLRREFTFNTLLWRLQDLGSGPDQAEILDLTGCGLRDLRDGVLSCPRDPDVVFSDDPTRLIRLIKFVAKYGFKVPPDVAASAKRNAKRIKQAPWEAIATLFVQNVLEEPTAPQALRLMKSLGLLDAVAEMIKEQKPFAAYMAKQLKSHKVSLLLDLLDLGLSDPTPLKFLTPSQQARLREITVAMDHEDADAFVKVLEQPSVDNLRFIKEFNLKDRARALPLQYAREILLETPALQNNPDLLNDQIAARFGMAKMADVVAQKYAAKVLQFQPKPKHHITLAGQKYALSDYAGHMRAEILEEEQEGQEEMGAMLIELDHPEPFRFLWLFDEDHKKVAMFRVTDGDEKAFGSASYFQRDILRLESKGELNRVSAQELDRITKIMRAKEREHAQALEALVKEMETPYQKQVNEIAQQVFDREIAPVLKRKLREAEMGVVPFGFQLNDRILNHADRAQQIRSHVLTTVLQDFTTDLVEMEMRKRGVDPEAPGRDIQAAYWAVNDIQDATWRAYR